MIEIHNSQLPDLLGKRFKVSDKIEGVIACLEHYSNRADNEIVHGEVKDCDTYFDYMEGQIQELEEEFRVNRHYLSERENHDIGEEKARTDYFENHLDGFAEGFRRGYCNHVCSHREDCHLKVKGERIIDED